MKKLTLIIWFVTFLLPAFSQENEGEDTILTGELSEVLVRAYEQNRRLKDVPAAISYINRSSLNRYNNTNILPALNTAPGIRMEERSPGSYRLNIRGSSLRSPFGVRNVKVYYNYIPLTDPGGTTYLNQLGFYNFQSIEIIKGPGSSLYGSGTGGVMLIESTSPAWSNGFDVNYSMGSYGLQNVAASTRLGSDDFQNTLTYQHQTSDGYRQQSAMRRDVFSWNTIVRGKGSSQLSANFLYGDLYYQTPGALTLTEYNTNARSARPRAGASPGAVENRAAIYQKTFLAGATYKHVFNEAWQNTTTFYGAYTQLKNPTIRNYERNNMPHLGGRTTFQFRKELQNSAFTLHAGAEFQQGLSNVQTFINKGGNPDSLQTNDEISNRQAFAFTQLSWVLKKWIFTGGLSLNQLQAEITRLSTLPVIPRKRKYSNELAPRIAVLRKLDENISAYASIAKGFSPPTSAELLPSTGIINTTLNAEHGNNYEAGLKGGILKGRVIFDLNAYYFQLKNTIVQRRDVTGGDYFINAGSTRQRGLESYVSYQPSHEAGFFGRPKLWLSHTWNSYHYKDFKQVTNDFSGKQLPSTAPHTVSAGLDIVTNAGIYLNTTYYYSDPIALNDANSDYAGSYNLVGSRLGYRAGLGKGYEVEVFGGVDNLFDLKYSLGNDINAFGGRYFNAAAGRNYYAGISLRSHSKAKK